MDARSTARVESGPLEDDSGPIAGAMYDFDRGGWDTLGERARARRVDLRDFETAESAVRAERQFVPDYGIEGPFYPRPSRRTLRRVVAWVIDVLITTAFVGCLSFTIGALGRRAGLF
jgi:hypothetical protein